MLIGNINGRGCLENIYYKYNKMMFSCALEILKNHRDAEDAVHQVLLNLRKYTYNLKKASDKRLAGYLYETTRNQCLKMIEKYNHIVVSHYGSPESKHITEAAQESITAGKYDHSVLVQAFNKLTPCYRQIIMDDVILHLNDKQIAAHNKINAAYVSEYLSRAREELRSLYLKMLEDINISAVSDREDLSPDEL